MALGGGIWTVQNKPLPGSYINFVSASRATLTFSDRGYSAVALPLSWGEEGKVFTVEQEEFQTKSRDIFGYSYDADEMKNLRELFLNAKTVYFYKLNTATKAVFSLGYAKYGGVRGNDLKVVISANVDDPTKYDVLSYLGTSLIDNQTVGSAAELIDNNFIVFDKEATIAVSAGEPLTGGTDGTVNGDAYQSFLNAIEGYYFNTLICTSIESTIKSLYFQYTKRMRDDIGAKFQCVIYRYENADYEGVISVQNKVLSSGSKEHDLVYWVGGAEAACAVNKSLTNTAYNGELEIETAETQTQLKQAIESGKFMFHKVNDKLRVLTDINSFTSFTSEKNSDFSKNQTIRVLDQVATDIATIFNERYLGKVPNDNIGRTDLWKDIVKHHETLQSLRAIQDFEDSDITIAQGEAKDSVLVIDYITPVNAMEKLYMTVVVA